MCDCRPNPVRAALERLSVRAVESALGTAQSRLEAARRAGDTPLAEILTRVVSGFEDELRDRVAVVVARDVVDESREAERHAKALLNQITS